MSARHASGAGGAREILCALVPVALIGLLVLEGGGFDLPIRQQAWLAVWWLLGLGIAFGAVPRSTLPRGWRLIAGGLIGLAALQLTSVAWGPSDDRAIADACRSVGYLGLFALAWGFLGPRSWSSAATGLFAIAAAVTVYALLGRLAPDLTGLDDPFGAGRLAEPLGYWNGLAAWAAITLAMALAWSADALGSGKRALAAALLPVAATVVYLTYSRGGVLAAAVGVALVVALSHRRERAALHALVAAVASAFCVLVIRSQPQIADGSGDEGALIVGLCVALAAGACWLFARVTARRGPLALGEGSPPLAVAGAGALALALVLVALIAGGEGFGRGGDAAALRDGDPSARLTTAAGNRSAYWSEALDAFASSPLRGEGAGSFGFRWAMEGSDPELVNDPHSLAFATAAELGLLGLIALGAFVVGLVAIAARGLMAARGVAAASATAGGLAAFLVSVAIDWTWESTALATLGLGCAAVLGMAASKGRAAARGGSPAPRGPSTRVRWGAFAVALALGAMQIPSVVATDLARDSEQQRRLGDVSEAISRADRALTAAPWSAAAYAARAEARLDAGRLEVARSDAREAIEREPLEAEHRILLATIEAADDDLDAVVEALREATRLSPHEPRLGSREIRDIGERLERHGFDEADIIGGLDE